MPALTCYQILERLRDDLGPIDVPDLFRAINFGLERLAADRHWRHYQKEDTITIVAAYDTGTVDMTLDDATVTGTGTTFTSAMVGRKFAVPSSFGTFTVASFTSATEIELDRVWPHASLADTGYKIYQDDYALPSDVNRILRIVDATSGDPLNLVAGVDRTDEWQGSAFYTFPSSLPPTGSPWEVCQWSVNGSNVPKVILRHISSDTRELIVYYSRTPTAVTSIGNTPDVAEYMQEALYQAVVQWYSKRLPRQSAEEMNFRSRRITEADNDYDKALKLARRKDATYMDIQVRNRAMFL